MISSHPMMENKNYINQYIILHKNKNKYGASSEKIYEFVLNIIKNFKISSILDYGCGKSKFVDLLSDELKIKTYKHDPALINFSKLPNCKIDFILCTNVLQHVPEYDLDNVLKDINKISENCFLY